MYQMTNRGYQPVPKPWRLALLARVDVHRVIICFVLVPVNCVGKKESGCE